MAKKDILVLSPLYPPHVGGLESHAQQWNREMSSLGYQVTVWTPNVVSNAPSQEYENEVRVLRYPAFEIISNYPIPAFWNSLFWKQFRYIRKKHGKHSLIVSRTRFFFSSLLAVLFAKYQKSRLLHIEHGSDFVQTDNSFISFIARLYDYTLGKVVLKSADLVVANSKASAVFVQKLSGRTSDAIIYRGVELNAIKNTLSSTLKDVPTIMYVGRLIRGKGVHDALIALASSTSFPWHLYIIGDGPEKFRLQTQARALKIEKRVTFLGELSWTDTISQMKAADIIVNPSYTEGMPTSVIEAALCKTAIIATNVGGTREILSSALFFEPRDTNQLTEHIEKLLNSPALRREITEKTYQEVENRFSWKTSARAYQRIIEEAV